MGQEFFIKSDDLESKVRQLLPSQGGQGAGFDLSASTQIVPIVDLTESAEGSNFRQDLQTAFSFDACTPFAFGGATQTIITNTGYFRIFAVARVLGSTNLSLNVSDGLSTKTLFEISGQAGSDISEPLNIIVFNPAGYNVSLVSSTSDGFWLGNSRQIATIDGELVNP